MSFARSLISALLITLLLVASAPFLKAVSEAPQTQWSSTAYYGYSASCVIETEDGGLVAGGTVEIADVDSGATDFRTMLVKTDSSGQMQWSRTYGNQGAEVSSRPRSVVQTNDSGYILSGHNGWLLKTDAEGNMEWFKTIEPQADYKVIQTSDGRYVLAGFEETSVNLVFYGTSYLLKINQDGNTVWMRTFGESDSVYLNDVVEAVDGGYVVAGSWEGEYFLAKTDIYGGLLWNKTYSYENYWQVTEPRINSVARTEDGGYILAGGDGGGAWLIKVDSEGNEQWNCPYLDGEFFHSVAQTADGGYVLTGVYEDAWLIKVNSSGNLLWTASYVDRGGPRTSYSVISTVDGGYAVAGQLAKSLWLAKFAPEVAPSPDIPSPAPEGLPALFPMIWIVTAVIIVAVVGVGLLLYFKKRKR